MPHRAMWPQPLADLKKIDWPMTLMDLHRISSTKRDVGSSLACEMNEVAFTTSLTAGSRIFCPDFGVFVTP